MTDSLETLKQAFDQIKYEKKLLAIENRKLKIENVNLRKIIEETIRREK